MSDKEKKQQPKYNKEKEPVTKQGDGLEEYATSKANLRDKKEKKVKKYDTEE